MMVPKPTPAALVAVGGLVVLLAVVADADAPPDQYILSTDAVYDTKTKLTWQRNAPAAYYSYYDAAFYCQGLSADGGGSGWRLPTIKELQTIVDDTVLPPTVDPAAFPDPMADLFWSSTIYVNDTNKAWGVAFNSGGAYESETWVNGRVRCVR
jgi:hypothetical protein